MQMLRWTTSLLSTCVNNCSNYNSSSYSSK